MRRQRRQWIARDDFPAQARCAGKRSAFCLLFGELAEGLFGFFDVIERQLARLHKVSHDGLGASAEKREEIVDEAALRVVARNSGLEDVKITNLAHTTDDVFVFHAI